MGLQDGSKLKEGAAARGRRRRSALEGACAAEPLAGRMHNRRLPPLVIEERDPRSLRAPGRNVKAASDAQVARVGRAIAELDYIQPVLITAEGEIVDGVSSVEAAVRLGLGQVPVIVVSHLDADRLELLRVALNRLPQRAEWDLDVLRVTMLELVEAELSVDIVFDTPELDLILEPDGPAISKRHNAAPRRDEAASAAMPSGGLWRLGEHRLIQGDARDPEVYRRLLGSTPARLVLTDPPYNVGADVVSGLRADRQGGFLMGSGELDSEGFVAFLGASLGAAATTLADGGLLYSFMDWRHIRHLVTAGEGIGLELLNMAVWVKTQAGMGSLYRSQHELCAIFKKGAGGHVNNVRLGRHGRDRSNIWRYPGANTLGSSARAALGEHATPKCVEMISDAMLDVSRRGEAVLDPFMGSGTTLVAAETTGRVAYGVELDPRYVDVILRRWQALTGVAPVLEGTGETYEQVRARTASARDDVPGEGDPPRPRIRVKAGTRKAEKA